MTTIAHAIPAAGAPLADDAQRNVYVIDVCVDFAVTNYGAGDVGPIANLPLYSFLDHVMLEVLTPEGGTATGDVGDTDDPDGFLDGVDLNAAAGTAYPSNNAFAAPGTADVDLTAPKYLGLVGGKGYTSTAKQLLLTSADATDAGKVRITGRITTMRGKSTVGLPLA